MQPKLLQMIVSNEFLKQRETEAFLKFNHLDWAFWQPERLWEAKFLNLTKIFVNVDFMMSLNSNS